MALLRPLSAQRSRGLPFTISKRPGTPSARAGRGHGQQSEPSVQEATGTPASPLPMSSTTFSSPASASDSPLHGLIPLSAASNKPALDLDWIRRLRDFQDARTMGLHRDPPSPGDMASLAAYKASMIGGPLDIERPVTVKRANGWARTQEQARKLQAAVVRSIRESRVASRHLADTPFDAVALSSLASGTLASASIGQTGGQRPASGLWTPNSESTAASPLRGSSDGNFIFLSPQLQLAPSDPRSSTYPVDLLTSFFTSGMYRAWYPTSWEQHTKLHGNPGGAGLATLASSTAQPGQHVRQVSMGNFSNDMESFSSYIKNILRLMRPISYAIERAVEYAKMLRVNVDTPESHNFGSHYAVSAVSLMLAVKVLDGRLLANINAGFSSMGAKSHPPSAPLVTDSRHSIAKWSIATAIPNKVLRRMELEFATMIDWKF